MNQHKLLSPDIVEPLLRGRFGRPYLWVEECASTQDLLRGADLHEGAVAVTEHQTAGRGREGKHWDDAVGRSLLASVLLHPRPGSPAQQLALVVGLSVAAAIDAVAGTAASIKWPNDVLVDDRKVAGVLLESTGESVVCGIGVNVNTPADVLPPDTHTRAGSLLTTTGREHDRAELLARLLVELQHRYDEWIDLGLGLFVPELERRDALRGRVVTVGDVSGTAAGVAPDGRLRLVRDDGSKILVASGEVALR